MDNELPIAVPIAVPIANAVAIEEQFENQVVDAIPIIERNIGNNRNRILDENNILKK